MAIRNQVDDYLIKPADIGQLVQALKAKSEQPRRLERAMPSKRVFAILRENAQELT